MNNEGKGNSIEPENIPAKGTGSKREMATPLAAAGSEDTNPPVLNSGEKPVATETSDQAALEELSSLAIDRQPGTYEAAVPFKQETAALPEASFKEANPSVQNANEKPAAKETRDQVAQDGSPASSVESAPRTDEVVSSVALKPVFVSKHHRFLEERTLPVVEMSPHIMRHRTRREVLAFGIG